MAEAAVTHLLPKLQQMLDNEMQFHGEEFDEMVYVRGELERFHVFLKKADAHEENDEELKVWVKQLRDIAHDAEDIIDEFTILKVHNHDYRPFSSLRKLSCCVMNLKARQRVVSRVKNISNRMRDISKQSGSLRWQFASSSERGDEFLVDESDLVGILQPKSKLVDLLINGDLRREGVALTGMAGIGKSTLAKQVYDDDRVKKHFDNHAWVTVSQSYKEEVLLEDIVRQLFTAEGMPVPSEGVCSSSQLKEKTRDLLKNKRYLIVFDDIWTVKFWDSIKSALPFNDCGSRVVITTRDNDVASAACSDSKKIHKMDPLSSEESWALFCKKTFKGNTCPRYLEDICRKILRKCEGLPLAIVAIGGALAKKDKGRVDEWDMVLRSLGTEIEDNTALQNMRKVLSLSFHELPNYLKPCFLYLCMFPADYQIARMRLVRLWVAERFANPKDGKEPEDVADEYFQELVSRNLLQVAESTTDGRIKSCRLHDLLREIAVTKSRDQNFAVIAKASTNPLPDKVRRLSVHHLQQNEYQLRSSSHLRSLIMFRVELQSPRVLLTGDFKMLNVLDLKGLPITVIPSQVINLTLLRHLGLHRTKVAVVPKWVGSLHRLETLNLKHTFVTELPEEIVKLTKLRHLLLYRYEIVSFAFFESKHGFRLSKGIGSLRDLQKLCFLELAQDNSNNILAELSQLTQLRRLGLMKVKEADGKNLCTCLENLQNLRALSLLSEEENKILDLQHLGSPPQFLQRLYLAGRLEELPRWISNLDSLIRLHLKWSRLREDPLPLLQTLPNLVHLELLQAYKGDKLCFRTGGFRKLKHLCIDRFDDLTNIEVEAGAMPRLEKLYIQRCQLLLTVPFGIEYLTKLKVLQLAEMNQELVNSLRSDDESGSYKLIAHITEVQLGYYEGDNWKLSPLHGRQVVMDGKFKPSLK